MLSLINKSLLAILIVAGSTPHPIAVGQDDQPQIKRDNSQGLVFRAGMNGFASIRIPAVLTTKSGKLLAFAEGRAADKDQAFNKIVLRISSDLGNSWNDLRIIADSPNVALNNPCAVLEQQSGTIFLTYQSYPGALSERSGQIETGFEGEDIVRCWLISSDDEGVSWSTPREITRSAKREKRVTTIASGPGVGIQLSHGIHSGRLVFPFNEGPFGSWNIYTVYSDDHGQTWQMGDVAPGGILEINGKRTSQVNECQVVELDDGRLMMNARRWAGSPLRKATFSADGGHTWSQVQDIKEIADPSCMGSMIRCKNLSPDMHSVLLFSGPNSNKRSNGSIFISVDQGRTWPKFKIIEPGLFAYSCLVELPDASIGCLYEAKDMSEIRWLKLPINDLLK